MNTLESTTRVGIGVTSALSAGYSVTVEARHGSILVRLHHSQPNEDVAVRVPIDVADHALDTLAAAVARAMTMLALALLSWLLATLGYYYARTREPRPQGSTRRRRP